MKLFLIALQFLTILPIRIDSPVKERDFGKSLFYFPIVGLLIGILLVTILFLFNFLPHLVTIIFVLVASIIITGAIHLDGFADTCDGLYGFKTKEQALEIMHDSHIGVMGVVGIYLLLLLKFTLLVSIPRDILWKSLVLMPIFSRWTQVLACFSSQYARREGKAKYFVEYAGKKEIIIATLFTLVIFLLFLRLKGIILFSASTLPVYLCINYIKAKIGGMTGDTIGAISELAEVTILLFSLILIAFNL